MCRFVLALGVVVGLALLSEPARADDAAQARFFDRIARRHYAAGEYRQALQAFFEEQRLAPNPRIVFNIALCFERLGEDAQAYAFYVEYLGADDDDAQRRGYAQKAQARLSRGVSRVRVVTDPAGAKIFVDEETHGSYGTSPREIVVSPGKHTISVTKSGYRRAVRAIDVEQGGLSETKIDLVPLQGTMRVESTPAASVMVRDPDGRTVVEAESPTSKVLPEGLYTVELTAPGYQTSETVLRIEADETVTHTVALNPLPVRTSEVVFTSNVPGALVEVDGEPLGFAPVVGKLPEGPHTLRITHPERTAYESELAVKPDRRAWLTAQLEPPATTERSSLTWVSGALGAALLGAGAVVGFVANDRHDDFVAAQAEGRDDIFEIRSDGQILNATSDALMITGAVGIITGVILYFATERQVATPSSASVAWETE